MEIAQFSKIVRARLAKNAGESPLNTGQAAESTGRGSSKSMARNSSGRDLDYEASDGIAQAMKLIRDDAKLILISGRAGTGKSRFIRYLGNIAEGRCQIVVAPTGIAAMNLRAATIHKTFQLPFGVIDARDLEKRRIGDALRQIDRLVIDEISMVRADTLDAIDMTMRRLRADPRPFGGAQVVMVGDFLQLPPVVKQDEGEMLEHLGYPTPFAFSAKVVQDMDMKVVTLKKVWRQVDEDFIEVLGKIRTGQATQKEVSWLNSLTFREPRNGSKPIVLTPTRKAAESYNMEGLAAARRQRCRQLDLPQGADGAAIGEMVFEAKRTGTFSGERGRTRELPVADRLLLLPGLRVLAVKNGASFVNGSLGVVLSVSGKTGEGEMEGGHAMVLFDGQEEPVLVGPMAWEDLEHRWNSETGTIEKKVVGSFTQVPLVLGYAATIHKSQGLSLDDVRIDFGRGTFAPGQAYVALSRATKLAGLSLARPLSLSDISTDEMLKEFLAWASGNTRLEVVDVGYVQDRVRISHQPS
ncbi:ATP-dependent RecD-like DNA helicase [Paracoccus litorisediminis]|uniref:ATP-dependent DNA helicase n=1 Tax=Paracoccus litorisediminis TaxID=2006130 RepID=UPI00372EE765